MFHRSGILDQRAAVIIASAAKMGIQQLANERARHDHAFVDIKGQPAQIDFVEQIGRGFSRRDAPCNHLEDGFGLARGDPRGRERLELVGMKMQRLADQECSLGHGIGGAVREHQFCLAEAAHRIADEIKQREQLTGWRL